MIRASSYCVFLQECLHPAIRLVVLTALVFSSALVNSQVTELPPLTKPEKDQRKSGADASRSSAVRPPVEQSSTGTARSKRETDSAAPQMSERSGSHISPNASKPDISAASQSEQSMIQNACGYYQRTQGPAAYYNCLKNQMRQLESAGTKPDISAASQSEQSMIQNACGYYQRTQGPAAY